MQAHAIVHICQQTGTAWLCTPTEARRDMAPCTNWVTIPLRHACYPIMIIELELLAVTTHAVNFSMLCCKNDLLLCNGDLEVWLHNHFLGLTTKKMAEPWPLYQ